MSNGYSLGAAGLRIWNGARDVFNTAAGKLVNFLPTPNTYSFSAAFPDVPKGKIGLWSWRLRWSEPGWPDLWYWQAHGAAAVGARPQKWTDTIILGPAPAGANIFFGRARLTRTVNPSHTWLGETLATPAFVGQWVPINGSMVLEDALGFARALSIYVSGGNLVAYLDQSVSGQCGGYRSWSQGTPGVDNAAMGGQNAYLGSGAIAQPVWFPSGSPGRKTDEGAASHYFIAQSEATAVKWDGPNAPVYSDPTNYSSTYSVEVVGRFGRHA